MFSLWRRVPFQYQSLLFCAHAHLAHRKCAKPSRPTCTRTPARRRLSARLGRNWPPHSRPTSRRGELGSCAPISTRTRPDSVGKNRFSNSWRWCDNQEEIYSCSKILLNACHVDVNDILQNSFHTVACVSDFGLRRNYFSDDCADDDVDKEVAAIATSSSSFLSFRCAFLRFCSA
jgi:hypothetical protein